ncbi:MAG TPA: CBS domain-containing protein [Candidatus Acidoferrum sp.]|nr:CBS domain-containing protein [Candidatus Acidoferrum sp.]
MGGIQGHFTRELVALDAARSCREAAELMHRHKVGAIAVTRGGETIGLVSERDLVLGIVRAGGSADTMLGEVTRRDGPSVGPTASERECADLMRANHCRHLLVVDGGRVVGLVSMRDVIALMLDEKEYLIRSLEGYIRGV